MTRTQTGKRIRVLLIAYQCLPEGGSVAIIGWRWLRYLSWHCTVHLVTHVRNRDILDLIMPAGVRVDYVDTERFAVPLFKISKKLFNSTQHLSFMLGNLDFLYFETKARRICQRRAAEFDVCHVVTPVSPTAPHKLSKCGLPILLGPLNGGMTTPSGFDEIIGKERTWLYHLRSLGGVALKMVGTFHNADLIFSANAVTDRAIGTRFSAKIRRLCENGIEADPTVQPFPLSKRLELLFVGRLVPIKGLAMVFKALARLEDRRFFLRIAGDGPEEHFLKKEAERLGLTGQIEFLGFLTQAEVNDLYPGCHLNLLPSIRESGGATILEAMSHGRPSLALDHGGPSDYITPECGFLLPCQNTKQVVDDMTATFQKLVTNPKRLEVMGKPCLERSRTCYTWSAKIEFAIRAYRELIGIPS